MSGRRQLMIANQRGYDSDESAFLVETTAEDTTYQLNLRDTNTVRLHTIDWGDGTVEAVSTGTTALKAFQHVYTKPNAYEIRVRGNYYCLNLTSYSTTYARFVKEWYHASEGLTVMQSWGSFASIRKIGPQFKLPDKLGAMFEFVREGALPVGSEKFLQLPDSIYSLDGAFTNLYSDFDVTHMFDLWVTKSTSRNLHVAFSTSRNHIIGTVPDLWNQGFTFSNATNVFQGCTRLTNYNDIPASWGGGGA